MGFFSDFFGGGDDAPTAPTIAPPPKIQEAKDFYNYLSGSKFDAKNNAVVRLPRTKEEQIFFDEYTNLLHKTIGNIKTIAAKEPKVLPNFMSFIGTLGRLDHETVRDLQQVASLQGIEGDVRHFRDISNNYLQERFDSQHKALEESLAHRGLSNSEEGNRERREFNSRMDKAFIDNDWNTLQYGENLASQRLNRNITGFNARQMGRQNMAKTAETAFNLERQQYADEEAARAMRLAEQGNILNQTNALVTQDYQKAMGGNVDAAALNRHTTDNQIAMNHYQADSDRIYKNYGMQMAEHNANAQNSSFGSTLLGLAGTVGGAVLTAPSGGIMGTSFAGKLGNKIGSWL